MKELVWENPPSFSVSLDGKGAWYDPLHTLLRGWPGGTPTKCSIESSLGTRPWTRVCLLERRFVLAPSKTNHAYSGFEIGGLLGLLRLPVHVLFVCSIVCLLVCLSGCPSVCWIVVSA